MELISKLRKYVLEEDFKMQLGTHYVDIVNYTKLVKIEHTEIVIAVQNTNICIFGTNLAIQKLLQEEVFITGKIEKVFMKSDAHV